MRKIKKRIISMKLLKYLAPLAVVLNSYAHAATNTPTAKETANFVNHLTATNSKCNADSEHWYEKYDGSRITLIDDMSFIGIGYEYTARNKVYDAYAQWIITKRSNHFDLKNIAEIKVLAIKATPYTTGEACKSSISFKCKNNNACMNVEYDNQNVMDGSTENFRDKSSSFDVPFAADFETSKKIVRALLHFGKLHGLDIEDGTVNENLF